MRKNKCVFITATDTYVGKTIATFVLGVLLRAKGYDIGVMKPVQCAGDDAVFLKEHLGLDEPLSIINPCHAPEPLSPHLAFRRAKKTVDIARIRRAFKILQARHQILLVEGAGGLMVPLKKDYYNADLIRELNAEVIIVARLGLGTINHTLLTINQAKAYGLKVKGVLFSTAAQGQGRGLAAITNPCEVKHLSGVNVLGVIPHLKQLTVKEVLKKCQRIAID